MATDPLLSPTNLRSAAAFDRARELYDVLAASEDPDEIGQALEAAASDADLAQAVMFQLLVKARGWGDGETRTGVELVANALRPGSLILGGMEIDDGAHMVTPEELWTP